MTEPEWQVADVDAIAEPGAIEFRVGEDNWPFRGILVRWNGAIYAYANSCAHLGHPLNIEPDRFFNPDRELLVCASHGALFEPATGKCVAGPCTGAGLRVLACRVEDGRIYVRAPASQREQGNTS
jgi:nitrite reductase/ring-hydroxylating ferredoxin subunit